jgi:putative ABC transport system ATP-binding protein
MENLLEKKAVENQSKIFTNHKLEDRKMRKSKKSKEIVPIIQEAKDYELDSEAMIQTLDLTKIYNITEGIEIRALNGVSIDVKKGEFVSVMGPSGSGKTTLLNMIGALDNPTSGAVYINSINVAHMDDQQRTNLRLKEIGFIFQFYNLVPVLSAYENVELPMIFAGKTKQEIEKNVTKFLDLVGLNDKKDHLPSELSGGEQQRVAIARALCNEPSILIADEPTGELDTKMGMEIVKLLRELNLELNQTILMVTHDPSVGELAERMLKMRDGKIIETIITKN